MPTISISVNDIAGAPRTPGEKLQRLFKAHSELERGYGDAYRAVKGMLDAIIEGEGGEASADDPAVPNEPGSREKLKQAILDTRKQTVLDFKRGLKIVELAINELAPGTFDLSNEPLQSDDRGAKDLKDDLIALAALSAAITAAAALIPGGQGVAAFGAGFTIGVTAGIAALEFADVI